jgi:phosphoribosylcarboxyaminoimidazole (NCAIR) mutase
MPTGVPVACMAIDGAANAALFAAMTIPAFRHRVNKYQLEAQARVENSLAK